jgi:cell division protein FtsA
MAEAEKIKIRFGCAHTSLIPKDEVIDVPSVGGREPRQVSRQILGRIIEARMEEILIMAAKEINRSEFEDLLAAGIVLTGGTATLEGIVELAEQVFNMPVRRGYPMGIGGIKDVVNDPMFATGVGLMIYGSRNISKESLRKAESSVFAEWIGRFKKWVLEYF